MCKQPKFVSPTSLFTGWDFSTGATKCIVFDMEGRVVVQVAVPTDLWYGKPGSDGKIATQGLRELNVMLLEGQVHATLRAVATQLQKLGRLGDWVAGGISATHHTASRVDRAHNPLRRAIAWNDETLAEYRRRGERRIGGSNAVKRLLHTCWADRYTLSGLLKDEDYLSAEKWRDTYRILSHGPLAAGYLTNNFNQISVSAAASFGLMNLKTLRWSRPMLNALKSVAYRRLVWQQLPEIVRFEQPLGRLAPHMAVEAGIDPKKAPWIFPTSDDQAAGLCGGGAVDDEQMAIICGHSLVVNTACRKLIDTPNLDLMRLNWGPYLVMRCYNNGADFLNAVIQSKTDKRTPDFAHLENEGHKAGLGSGGVGVLPFHSPEPSLSVTRSCVKWFGGVAPLIGQKYRACLEAFCFMIALGVEAHVATGQNIKSITLSGGIARSDLFCEILATVLNRPLKRLDSEEGPALGAAVTALAALESYQRKTHRVKDEFTVSDATQQMVRFGETMHPNKQWTSFYQAALARFKQRLKCVH